MGDGAGASAGSPRTMRYALDSVSNGDAPEEPRRGLRAVHSAAAAVSSRVTSSGSCARGMMVPSRSACHSSCSTSAGSSFAGNALEIGAVAGSRRARLPASCRSAARPVPRATSLVCGTTGRTCPPSESIRVVWTGNVVRLSRAAACGERGREQ